VHEQGGALPERRLRAHGEMTRLGRR
jgi:hypothetical protein